ncbi:MAG TPA: hypothetical protein VF483_09045, partial [Gemmatimonadaceae bacterium]
MKTFSLALIVGAALAAPLTAQTPATERPSAPAPKGKQPADRILAWELESYGDASLTEVIEKARPKFFMPDQTRIDFGMETAWR